MYRLFSLLGIAVCLHSAVPLRADPIGYSLYQERGQTQLYQINFGTGVATPVGPTFGTFQTGSSPLSLTSTPSGLVALGQVGNDTRLYTFPTLGGSPQLVGSLGIGRSDAAGLAFDRTTGQLFGLIPDNQTAEAGLYGINAGSGAATPIGSQAGNPYADGLAINGVGAAVGSDGDAAYGNGFGMLYDVDLVNGLLLNGSQLDIDPNGDGILGYSSLGYDPDGNLWMLLDNGSFFAVLSGNVSSPSSITNLQGDPITGGTWRGVAFLLAVPEPSTLVILGVMSAAGLIYQRRARRKSSATPT
jgi:hypothetical protein